MSRFEEEEKNATRKNGSWQSVKRTKERKNHTGIFVKKERKK